jgi:hypothetical protein
MSSTNGNISNKLVGVNNSKTITVKIEKSKEQKLVSVFIVIEEK